MFVDRMHVNRVAGKFELTGQGAFEQILKEEFDLIKQTKQGKEGKTGKQDKEKQQKQQYNCYYLPDGLS